MIYVVIILSILLVSTLILYFRSISKLKNLESKVKYISTGNFTETFDSKKMGLFKNLGSILNSLLKNFRKFIANVNSSTDHVEEFIEHMTLNAERINEGAIHSSRVISEIASSTEKQSSSIVKAYDYTEQIIKDFNTITKRTENAIEKALSTKNIINTNNEIFNKLLETIKKNTDNSIDLVSKINRLEEKANEINVITKSVKDISENTNLLALNASIEAARAGEMGKGFAVVANEVKSLADESSRASAHIGELINSIKDEISAIASEIRADSNTMNEDISIADDAKEHFNNIVVSTDETITLIDLINKLAKEEQEVINNIKEFMEGVAATSQQHTSATQEASVTIEQQTYMINDVFNSLKELTNKTSDIKNVINSFVKSYEIKPKTQEQIDLGVDKLKSIAKDSSIVSIDKISSEKYMQTIIEQDKNFEIVTLLDSEGNTIGISYNKELDLGDQDDLYDNFKHRDYFKKAINGDTYLSDPYISTDSYNYCIAISVPVKDESGKIEGVLMADFALL